MSSQGVRSDARGLRSDVLGLMRGVIVQVLPLAGRGGAQSSDMLDQILDKNLPCIEKNKQQIQRW